MKNVFLLLFLSIPVFATSQAITEEQIIVMVESAQEQCVGAHESFVLRTNEGFAKSIWGKKVRFNEANIIKFFNKTSGEKISAGFDIYMKSKSNWRYSIDPKTASDLLTENGVRVTKVSNQPWIIARQNILYAENIQEENKITLELYCPYQRYLDILRLGQIQSIEFLITGFSGSISSDSKIYGVLTQVNIEKLTIKCSNGHEFDQDVGYKFCPTCGEPLK